MSNIFLICTRRENLVRCNSQELDNIIERIKPDLIFEETPLFSFDHYYVSKIRNSLESNAINAHVCDYNILNIPIDSDDLHDRHFLIT